MAALTAKSTQDRNAASGIVHPAQVADAFVVPSQQIAEAGARRHAGGAGRTDVAHRQG